MDNKEKSDLSNKIKNLELRMQSSSRTDPNSGNSSTRLSNRPVLGGKHYLFALNIPKMLSEIEVFFNLY